jgi:hypothetical protein
LVARLALFPHPVDFRCLPLFVRRSIGQGRL